MNFTGDTGLWRLQNWYCGDKCGGTDCRYDYEIRDHLGNVRVVLTHDGEDEDNEPDILAYTDYYPFGMEMPGMKDEGGLNYSFGYQGEFAEKDHETDYNHFEARLYDARIGRWMVTDPAGQYWSPYLGMGNVPMMGVDPDGRWLDKWTIDGNGNAKFENDNSSTITVNGSLFSEFDFTGNEKALAQMGNHYSFFNIGGLGELQNSSMSAINFNKSYSIIGGFNLLEGARFSKNFDGTRMFKKGRTMNIVLNSGFVSDLYDNKYNFISDIVHERAHILQNKNYGAWGELIAIQKQMLHYSWSKSTPNYRNSIESYSFVNMQSCLSEGSYVRNVVMRNRIMQMYDFMYSNGFTNYYKNDYDWERTVKGHGGKW